MDTMHTKQELIERISEERASWEAVLEGIPIERMTDPGPMGDWSFKDLVAHLNGWWHHELRRLVAAQLNEPLPLADWESNLDIEQRNQQSHVANQDRSVEQVLQVSRDAWQQLEDLVRSLPEHDLLDPGHFDFMEDKALGPQVLDDFFSHYPVDHADDVRVWLAGISN